MIFFFFSVLGSLFGGLTAGRFFGFSLQVNLSVDSPFSGIVAFWPFIVVLVLLLLVVLWYQNIKNIRRRRTQAGNRKRPGTPAIVLMGIVTVLVLVLLAAPYYLETFADKYNGQPEATPSESRVEMVLTVHGMDCGGCESLVNRRVAALEGVESVVASHMAEEVALVYDKNQISLDVIAQTIEDSGYTVVLE